MRAITRDLRHLLRHHRRAQFHQRRRAVHRRPIGQPGPAARDLCGV